MCVRSCYARRGERGVQIYMWEVGARVAIKTPLFGHPLTDRLTSLALSSGKISMFYDVSNYPIDVM